MEKQPIEGWSLNPGELIKYSSFKVLTDSVEDRDLARSVDGIPPNIDIRRFDIPLDYTLTTSQRKQNHVVRLIDIFFKRIFITPLPSDVRNRVLKKETKKSLILTIFCNLKSGHCLYYNRGHSYLCGNKKLKPFTDISDSSRYVENRPVSTAFLNSIVDYFESKDLIEHEKGQYDWTKNIGNASSIIAKPKLLKRLSRLDPAYFHNEIELICLKDKADITTEHKDQSISTKTVTYFKDYEDNQFTIAKRNNLTLINSVNKKYDLSILGETMFDRVVIPYSPLRRHFTRTFTQGGRFFGGWWQGGDSGLTAEQRQQLMIDNEDVTEIDFKCLGLRIAYNHFLGTAAPSGDLYELSNLSEFQELTMFHAGKDDKLLRKCFKMVFNVATNVSSKESLQKTIKTMLSGRGKVKLEKPSCISITDSHDLNHHFSADDLIDCILSDLEPLKDYILQKNHIGPTIQFLESELAESIMLVAATFERAIYPVHDSFLMKESESEGLERLMLEKYKKMFGYQGAVEVKGVVSTSTSGAPDRSHYN